MSFSFVWILCWFYQFSDRIQKFSSNQILRYKLSLHFNFRVVSSFEFSTGFERFASAMYFLPLLRIFGHIQFSSTCSRVALWLSDGPPIRHLSKMADRVMAPSEEELQLFRYLRELLLNIIREIDEQLVNLIRGARDCLTGSQDTFSVSSPATAFTGQHGRPKYSIGLLQITVTWYKICHAGGQAYYYSRTGTAKQCYFILSSLNFLCFGYPSAGIIISLPSSMTDFVPCDRQLLKAYSEGSIVSTWFSDWQMLLCRRYCN